MTLLFSSWHRTLLVLFMLALFARGVFISTQQGAFYFPDSVLDFQAAKNLLENAEFGPDYDRAPAYPVFLAAVFTLFGESILAVRIVESLMGALLAVLIAALGKRAGGELVGMLAGTVWSFYPLGIFLAGLVYPTTLGTTLLACGVWCVLPDPQEEISARGVLFGGIFLGLAALAIPVALLTIVFVAAWVFYWGPRSPLLPSVLLLGAALSLVPWTARTFFVHGQLVAVQPVQQHLPRIPNTGSNVPLSRLERILQRPDLFAAHFGRQFLGFWQLYPDRIKMSKPGYREKLHRTKPRLVRETIYRPGLLISLVSIISTGPVLLFAVVGAAAMWLTGDRRQLLMLLATIFSFALGYSLFVGKIRYRIPVEPYIIILGAYGMTQTWQFLSQRYDFRARPSCKNIRANQAIES
jgi:4-amino-4-deoxy-L-arabinose transferase-like glycosyltransferase